MTTETKTEGDDLETIALIVQSWIDFSKSERDAEGLEATDDTHIMRVPWWPTHGALTNWVKTLRQHSAALAQERERCARIADALASEHRRHAEDSAGLKEFPASNHWNAFADGCDKCAESIRSLTPEKDGGE